MKRSVIIQETRKQKTERRAVAAVNDGKQYRIHDFTWAKYGVKPR